MTYANALNIFQKTLDAEKRVSTTINVGLLKLADQAAIEEASQWVTDALAREKRVWMTSDLHLGHANIVGYSDRPFGDVKEMTQAHMRLLRKVPENELLIFAGDMALGDYDSAVALIRSMPGRKVLVAGNHDLNKDGQFKFAREKDLFDAVVPFLFWSGGLGRMVMVTHYPVMVTAHETTTSVINYHGHLHQHHIENTPWVKYINVGWDVAHGLICL
jgi:calcineurin-like phosphoesterase family protein